mgnify:CR=1 FL=1
MIVQSTQGFVESLNLLSASEAKTAKRFLRPLCDAIEHLADGMPITSIALSNYLICEERGAALAASIAVELGGIGDVAALSAIVVSGVYYMGLLADRAEVFNGVDISSDSGWERILGSLDRLVDVLVFSS